MKNVFKGGRFNVNGYDGQKYVCVDDLVAAAGGAGDPCLVYSFGVGNDLSFEETIVKYGEALSFFLCIFYTIIERLRGSRLRPHHLPLLRLRP